jgi:hypothetical protein
MHLLIVVTTYAPVDRGSNRIQSIDFGLDRIGLVFGGHTGVRRQTEGVLAGIVVVTASSGLVLKKDCGVPFS